MVLDQLERFAPGLRERVVATRSATPAGFAADNPNYVGGDIAGGANDLRQLVGRPRLAADPYATGVPGVYLCSASTPPGAGVHGMCGYRAAHPALRWPTSDERADRLDREVDLVRVGRDARAEPDVRRRVRRRAADDARSRSRKTASDGRMPSTSKQTMPRRRRATSGS